MSALLGQWRDRDGSIYTLSSSGNDIDVLTTRRNGEERFTRALIQCACDEAGKLSVSWGKQPDGKFVGTLLSDAEVIWKRRNSTFYWRRIR